jgi:cytochrome-b5 reductase
MEDVTRIKTKTPNPYRITAIQVDTHDTKTFRFALPENATLDMLPGDHLFVHATVNGKTVKRPYTPSSLPGTVGDFALTVKRYEAGIVSRHIHDQKIGDTVLMSGPNAGGHWVDGMAKKVGFVAGGTGITPMIAIIRWILAKRLDVALFLIFSNKTEADIIFRKEWARDVLEHTNFHCYHVLEQPPTGWTQESGGSPPTSCARNSLLLVQARLSSSAGPLPWLRPWKRPCANSVIPKRPSSCRKKGSWADTRRSG